MIIRRLPRPQVIMATSLRSFSKPRSLVTVSSAIAPGSNLHDSSAPIQRYPPTQPPSLKPADHRHSQLHRQYTSLIRSTPLMLIFQHNNLKAQEFAGIRRELQFTLKKVEADAAAKAQSLGGAQAQPAEIAKLQVVSKSVFGAALRVVEHYNPRQGKAESKTGAVPPSAQQGLEPMHYLSTEAYKSVHWRTKTGEVRKKRTSLDSMLSGPIAVLALPDMSPTQLAAALRILAPTPGSSSAFPAPRRRDQPGLYENAVQNGLQKLMLLGARMNGKAFDQAGVRYVGGLASRGGIDGLRGEVVALLQSVGMGLTSSLDRIGFSIWGALEGRRQSLEEEQKPAEQGEKSE